MDSINNINHNTNFRSRKFILTASTITFSALMVFTKRANLMEFKNITIPVLGLYFASNVGTKMTNNNNIDILNNKLKSFLSTEN